jgi:enoyl-CoA hydratase/carnithine racemase
MREEFIHALDQADADDDIRVIVITGAGRGFCAGFDLSIGGDAFDKDDGEARIEEHRDSGGLLTLRLFECKKPVIAAINGPAVGIGATMTLPMDIRIASENAKMGFVFTRRGIVPEACSSWFLPRLVGIGQALEWVMSGRVFPAQEALEGGLVSRVVAPDALLTTAYEIAREIADNTSAVSVALARHLLWRMLGADHPMEAHKLDSKCIFYMGHAPDSYEGVMSFLEKRPAEFTMKPSSDMPDFFPWWEERPFK